MGVEAEGDASASATGLRRSPLHDRHVLAGAKFAAFGGWSMPLEYAGAGVLAEHTAVRTAVGLFDVSHLGKARVTGVGAVAFLNRCLTADLDRLQPGQAQYTLICNDDGGVVDDLIAYLVAPDEVFLVPNAANGAQVVAMLRAAAPEGVEVNDEHEGHAVLAVQGPRSDETLTAAGLPAGHPYMSFVTVEHEGAPLIVCRTGYTGERGYELVTPAAAAPAVWDAVVAAGEPYGLQLAGLGARDTLRTEMGYPLARPGPLPGHHPGAGAGGVGGGVDQGRVLRGRRPPRREGGGPQPGAPRPPGGRPRDPAPGHGGARRGRGARRHGHLRDVLPDAQDRHRAGVAGPAAGRG